MNNLEINAGGAKKATLGAISCDTVITHDVSEEFTLPDYVCEVRRVLLTRAQVLPESKYISDTQGGTRLDFGGTVTYSVIYTDDEGKLCSTPLSSSYEASATLKCQGGDILVDTIADNVTTRVNAPRRLTVKTRLKSRILGFESRDFVEQIEGKSSADELFIERLTKNVESLSVASGSLQGIRMSEKFDTGSKKSLRPVLCDAISYLDEVRASNGGVSCRGSAIVKCLCESDGELVQLSRALPIYEEVELEGALQGDMARAEIRCVSLSISSEENDDGCELFFDLSCEIDAQAYRNTESILTADCYSTKNDMDTSYKTIDIYSAVKCQNGSMTFNDSIKRKSKDIVEIIDTPLECICEKCEIKGERAIIHGRLLASVIGKGEEKENGECEYLCENHELPFKYEIPLDKECENPIFRVHIECALTSARYADDKLHLVAELYPCVEIFDKTSESVLDSASIKKDKEFRESASCIRAYFPKDGDVLWEIAKRYHTSRNKIVEQNSLDGDSLDNIKSLII